MGRQAAHTLAQNETVARVPFRRHLLLTAVPSTTAQATLGESAALFFAGLLNDWQRGAAERGWLGGGGGCLQNWQLLGGCGDYAAGGLADRLRGR